MTPEERVQILVDKGFVSKTVNQAGRSIAAAIRQAILDDRENIAKDFESNHVSGGMGFTYARMIREMP